MMRGLNTVLQLPESSSLVKVGSLCSFDTLGTVYWTDGKAEPLLEIEATFGRHPSTGEFFWTKNCKVVGYEPWGGEVPPDGSEPRFRRIPMAVAPEFEDLERVESVGRFPGPKEEAYFRRRYWWLINDPQRRGGERTVSGPRFRDNLDLLLALTNPALPERPLMAIEMARELGEFDRAEVLLEQLSGKEDPYVVDVFCKLVAEKDSNVRTLTGR